MSISLEGFYNSLFSEGQWKDFLNGLKNTLVISLVACLIGIAIGLLIAVIKYNYANKKQDSHPGFLLTIGNAIANLYTTVIRGTPVVLQLLILYAVAVKGGFAASIIGFGINSGAYVSEIFRAGLNSVDSGQAEAGRSLGLSSGSTLRMIIVPQALKNVLPALFNEFISLIKETSVAGNIAVFELTKVADRFKGKTFLAEPLFIAALMYLAIVVGLTRVQGLIERRLARSDRS